MKKKKENNIFFLVFGLVLSAIVSDLIFKPGAEPGAEPGTQTGFLPRGIRNNNPGNIKFNSANNWLGKLTGSEKKDPTFEEFNQMKYGIRAALKLLNNYFYDKNKRTITDIIKTWSSGKDSYINFVSNRTGIPKNEYLMNNDLIAIAEAIFYYENGGQFITFNEINDVKQEFNII